MMEMTQLGQTCGKLKHGSLVHLPIPITCHPFWLFIYRSYPSISPTLPLSPSVLALVADLVGDEAVFPGLEVGLVQAVASVDHLLVLRGSLAVVLSAVSARLVADWVL